MQYNLKIVSASILMELVSLNGVLLSSMKSNYDLFDQKLAEIWPTCEKTTTT